MRTIARALLLAPIGLALAGGAPERSTVRSAPPAAAGQATAAPSAAVGSANPVPVVASDSRPIAAPLQQPQPSVAAAGTPHARPVTLDAAALRKALATVPALADLAAEFEPFSPADVDAALRRGGRSRESVYVWTFMPAVFAWSPRPGRELLVLSGRAGARALITVLEVKGEHRYEHAASLIVHEAETTLAVGYSDQYPDQLVWSSCYGCVGEGGTVRSLEDGRVQFGYR